jgi:predicted GIY-YIG superfamily endonuclease
MLAQAHCSLLTWRGQTVALTPPPARAYVYLIHFHAKIGRRAMKNGVEHYAAHYVGSSLCLDYRLAQHRAGTGAAILRACNERGVAWQVERLWTFENETDARLFEKKLKRASHGPRYCPVCNQKLGVDPLVALRRGHHRLARPIGKRQPTGEACPRFVRRFLSCV